MTFSIDTTEDTVTIDAETYSITDEADQAKIVLMNKLIDELVALGRKFRG